MITATVIGNVWSTRRLPELPNGAFLEVELEVSGSRLVAFDVLGSGIGERVLVAQGSVAAAWFQGQLPPIDALIVGSIDEVTGAEDPPAAAVAPARRTPAKKARGPQSNRPTGSSSTPGRRPGPTRREEGK
jgi:ethanolamine utilization protein EutN